MGQCKDLTMEDANNTTVLENGSGEYTKASGQLEITKGSWRVQPEEDKIYKVTAAGGTSPPPKGDYKCTNAVGNKKRFVKF